MELIRIGGAMARALRYRVTKLQRKRRVFTESDVHYTCYAVCTRNSGRRKVSGNPHGLRYRILVDHPRRAVRNVFYCWLILALVTEQYGFSSSDLSDGRLFASGVAGTAIPFQSQGRDPRHRRRVPLFDSLLGNHFLSAVHGLKTRPRKDVAHWYDRAIRLLFGQPGQLLDLPGMPGLGMVRARVRYHRCRASNVDGCIRNADCQAARDVLAWYGTGHSRSFPADDDRIVVFLLRCRTAISSDSF